VRTLVASFTSRARSLLAAGVSAALCGVVLGERDLLRVGFLLLALPVVGALIVGRARVTITAARSVSRQRAAVGAPIEASLRIANTGLLPAAGLMLEDRLPTGGPSGAPHRARFALGALRSGQSTDIVYPLPALPRGRFTVGPLQLRMTDPFGLIEMNRPFPAVSQIVIVPQIHELGAHPLPGGHEELGGSSIHALGSLGAEDLTVREYRQGDDVRKIHWRSSARTGELMVRQEERPWQGDVVVLVDNRRRAHRGEGAHSSLEWMVSAAASIADHLELRGYRVTIVSGGFVRQWPGSNGAETLADLQLSTDATLGTRLMETAGAASTLIALVAAPQQSGVPVLPSASAATSHVRLAGADADSLGVIQSQVRMLLALDTASWAPSYAGPPQLAQDAAGGAPRSAGSNGRRPAGPATVTTLGELAAEGWHVASAGRQDAIPAAWASLVTAPRYATAGRA
jgi:uncharacterized protein (DUF58 family)